MNIINHMGEKATHFFLLAEGLERKDSGFSSTLGCQTRCYDSLAMGNWDSQPLWATLPFWVLSFGFFRL